MTDSYSSDSKKKRKKWSWKKIVIVSLVIVIITTIILFAVAITDWMGYSAKDSTVLEAEGNLKGNALVVYNPGLSGQAKQAAMIMGEQLAAEGYRTTVCGVSSEQADMIDGNTVIIVGGPMYGGKCSSSIADYLGHLSPNEDVRLGVFTTTGNANSDQSSLNSLTDQVSSLTGTEQDITRTEVRLILTVNVDDDCRALVNDLIA